MGRAFVDDDALRRIDRPFPRRALQDPPGIRVAGLPAGADAVRREIDVLGVILAVERRCHEAYDVHRRAAAPGRELAHVLALARAFRQLLRELADDVPQMMDLLLPRDVAAGAARELDVLLPAHDLPQRL